MRKIDRIENEVILHGRRNNQAWFAPTIAVIPPVGKDKYPEVVLSISQLVANDTGPCHFLRTIDLGKTWTPPMESQNLFKIPLDDDIFEAFGEGLYYHKNTGNLLTIGSTGFVRDRGDDDAFKSEKYVPAKERNCKSSMAYAIWDNKKNDFEPWNKVEFPKELKFSVGAPGCDQRHECEDGTILIPGYYTEDNETNNAYSRVTVARYCFDGSELQYIEHGSIHVVEEERGLHEPSMIYFQDRYFMTIRHDLRGYVTTSSDGLHFDELKVWRFDDGVELGSYNTQQHWLKHNNTLYLVYTRKNELSNGVFRDRAPLFMAEVDPDTLRVRRATEEIVFPEKGARMGNFCVANVTANESWIVTGEWLEGTFLHSKKGKRFWVNAKDINYIQYIGNLLLARVHWKG